MKLIKSDNVIIYINKENLKNTELTKENLKKLIKQINKKYNINLYGFYNVQAYIDKNYGSIIVIDKDELEYLDYFNNDLELSIEIIKDSFLYKIEDFYNIKKIISKSTVRKQKENIYLDINNLTSIEMGIILENSIIIYGEESKKIKIQSEIINAEVIIWKNQ